MVTATSVLSGRRSRFIFSASVFVKAKYPESITIMIVLKNPIILIVYQRSGILSQLW